jgi:hypothetical protein
VPKQQQSHPIETRLKRRVGHDARRETAVRPLRCRKGNQINGRRTTVEPGDSWGESEHTASIQALLALAGKPDYAEWTAERRDRILHNVLARVDKDRERRRVARAFAAGASTVVVVGLLLKLITGIAAPERPSPEMAGTTPAHRLVAE